MDAHSRPAGILRLITCGSVDDGKSTLIGRLLHDAGCIMDDTLLALARDSRRHGTVGEEIDFALLLDGLEAEREQGITIDVAWRYFATPARKFIIADTPGHEQYTRNMATAASTADLAILLVDARKGLLPQTRRHAAICALMGVRHLVLAVNKMDLVGWDVARFDEIRTQFANLPPLVAVLPSLAIPMAARLGANLAEKSAHMPWYQGPSLLAHLETVAAHRGAETTGFRLPVQWVNRPNADFRGLSGNIVSGQVAVGDRLVVARTGQHSAVSRIVTADADLPAAGAGQAVTLVLANELDVARGDLLAGAADPPSVADQFAAQIVWLAQEPLVPGRTYLLQSGPQRVAASVTALKHRLDINDLSERPARELAMNEIGLANLTTAQGLAFDPYDSNRETGSFILIDRMSQATVGAGMIRFALRRATNIHRQAMDVGQAHRSTMKGHQPAVIWFTGLSGSGKSTIANAVESRLAAQGCHTYALDGDNIRHGLNRDLGFTAADRVENIRRIAEVARLMADAGLIVTCSFISPFRSEREMARDLIGAERFLEVFVDAPIDLCISRDPKGLYAKAKAGQLANFTGIDSPYEPPVAPDLAIASGQLAVADAAEAVIDALRARGIVA